MIKIGFGSFSQIILNPKTDGMWLSHKAVKIHNFYNDRDLYKQGVSKKYHYMNVLEKWITEKSSF